MHQRCKLIGENTLQYLYATLFPKQSCNNKFFIQNKSLVDLSHREWIFNINKPQVGKDPNNYNKPERNINEFEQASIKEKEPSPPTQKFFPLPQRNKWTLSRKENEKTLKIKKQI